MATARPWSTRTHLLILVLATLLPALGILVHRAREVQAQALARTEATSHRTVEDLGTHLAIQTKSVRKLLLSLSRLPEIQAIRGPSRQGLLQELAGQDQDLFTLLVIDPEGMVRTSSRPLAPFSVADRRYFREVQRTGRFSAGEFVEGRTHGRGTFHFALPALDEAGRMTCTLAAGLDPSHLLGNSNGRSPLEGATLSILDHRGCVIQALGPEAPPPGTLRPPDTVRRALGALERGKFTLGAGGEARMVAFRQLRLEGETTPYMTVVLEIPEAQVLGRLRNELKRDLMLLGLVFAIAVLGALFVGERLISTPLRRMVDAGRALIRGGAPLAEVPSQGTRELRNLGQTLQQLTEVLQARESSLQQSETRYRSILETLPEAVFLHDPATGRILEVSPRAAEMYGYPAADMLSCSIEDLSSGIPPFTQAEARAWLQKAEAEGPQSFPWEGRRWNGQCFPAEVNLTHCHIGGESRVLVSIRDVSERNQAYEELKEVQATLKAREDLLELFFTQSLDGFYIMTLDEPVPWGPPSEKEDQLERILDGMRLRRLNRAMAQQYGEPVKALIGRSIREFYRHDPEGLRIGLRSLLDKGRDHQITLERRADGSEIWIEGDYLCTFTEDGRLSGHFGVQRDITDRVKAEQALAASEARFKGVFDHTTLFLGVLDPVGTLLQANRTSLDFAGLEESQVLGRPFWDTPWWSHSELGRQQLRDAISRAAAGETVTFEANHLDRDGVTHEVNFTLKPILDAAGSVTLLLPEGQDISALRRSEEAVLERDRLFRLLFDRSGDPNLLLDGNLFLDCNPATVAILGATSRDQVLNTHPSDLSPEFQPDGRPSREKADEMIAIAFERGSHRFEWVHRRRDGQCFPVDVRLTAIPWEGRWILHTAWRDLTDREQAERERRSLESQMLQAQKLESLGVLAGGIAHDFNNLLTAILGNLNLAQAELEGTPLAKPYLEKAEKTVVKAAELAQQMLAYSGRGQFVVRQLDLNGLVEEMGELLQVSLSKKVTLVQQLAPDLPPVLADVAQLQQVVLNLVTNAAEAIGDQEGQISLLTQAVELAPGDLHDNLSNPDLQPGRFVSLEVRDTGCGIPPQVLAKIFDPFFTTKKSGRGLGLSAMLGILKAHGAGLRVHSREGKGSSFTVFLPAQAGKVEPPLLPQFQNPHPASGRILVVDDEPVLRETVQQALEHWGYRVSCAQDGQEAVELLQASPEGFDLVLMDLTMPRMDGREAFLAMRRISPGQRIILSSGYSEQESLRPLFEEGLCGFLQKPYPIRELEKRIRELLG